MRMSLRYKFILAFAIFSIGMGSIFAIITTQNFRSQLETQFKQHALHLAEHSSEEVTESQLGSIQHDLDVLARNLLTEDVIYFQVVFDGQVKVQQSKASIDLPIIHEDRHVHVEEIAPVAGTAYLDIVYPLHHAIEELLKYGHVITLEEQQRLQEGFIGYVRMGVSLAGLQGETQRGLLLIVGISLGLIAFGILIGWALYRMILGPIARLNAAVHDFGAGNAYARAQVHSGDEIEALAHEFNTMAASIVHQRDALRKTNEELETANRVKSTFLATMSHELRTPLHSILGYTSLLLEEVNLKLNDAGRQYTRAIQRAGKHLLSLIGNLLDFSKLEAGVEQLNLTEFNASETLHEVVESQRLLADGKQLRIDVEVEPQLPLRSDATKLKQVLLNLLNNAIKYTERGTVQVVAHLKEQRVCFEVADTGSGIAPEVQATLFVPFKRALNPDRPSEGMGLGLTVAKRYVELLGGALYFESTIGEGSHFWFSLPGKEPDEAARG